MVKSATITGIAIIIFGIWILLKILSGEETPIFILIYPVIIIIVGIAIITLRKEENKIEERKDIKRKLTKN